MREYHVRICERLGGWFLRPTRLNVYVKTQRAGDRAAASIQNFVEKKMKLKVNKEKSKVDKPVKRKFLGFSFYSIIRRVNKWVLESLPKALHV